MIRSHSSNHRLDDQRDMRKKEPRLKLRRGLKHFDEPSVKLTEVDQFPQPQAGAAAPQLLQLGAAPQQAGAELQQVGAGTWIFFSTIRQTWT